MSENLNTHITETDRKMFKLASIYSDSIRKVKRNGHYLIYNAHNRRINGEGSLDLTLDEYVAFLEFFTLPVVEGHALLCETFGKPALIETDLWEETVNYLTR